MDGFISAVELPFSFLIKYRSKPCLWNVEDRWLKNTKFQNSNAVHCTSKYCTVTVWNID